MGGKVQADKMQLKPVNQRLGKTATFYMEELNIKLLLISYLIFYPTGNSF